MNPKVSILIATYNRFEFLEKAIASALRQTWKDFEVVVVDDGSSDETALVVARAQKKDDRIRYFPIMHSGRISIVSNVGLRQARGKYIAILDDDDEWIDEEKLEKQVNFLDTNHDYVMCGGGIIADDGEKKVKILKPKEDAEIRKNFLIANPIANSTAMFRKSILNDVGLYDETLIQFADWDFWLKVGLIGKLYNFDECFTRYFMWEGGSSFSKQKANAKSALCIIFRYRKKYGKFFISLFLYLLYFLYSYVPLCVRKILNIKLSKLKKRIFSQ
jgi:glycosyltransferase involved in cell wall biosynthesis